MKPYEISSGGHFLVTWGISQMVLGRPWNPSQWFSADWARDSLEHQVLLGPCGARDNLGYPRAAQGPPGQYVIWEARSCPLEANFERKALIWPWRINPLDLEIQKVIRDWNCIGSLDQNLPSQLYPQLPSTAHRGLTDTVNLRRRSFSAPLKIAGASVRSW